MSKLDKFIDIIDAGNVPNIALLKDIADGLKQVRSGEKGFKTVFYPGKPGKPKKIPLTTNDGTDDFFWLFETYLKLTCSGMSKTEAKLECCEIFEISERTFDTLRKLSNEFSKACSLRNREIKKQVRLGGISSEVADLIYSLKENDCKFIKASSIEWDEENEEWLIHG